ncbi:serine/threonine-protein kinase [Planobispora takensis]|uniref:serine/threonine-protein kinase n=1 Tax=Planobispora takensis TaxID=1367882 RepID=UPI0019430F88|nr:serine/threonine-protein kinase [Planobispora takensis]
MPTAPLTPDDPDRLGEFRLTGRLGEGGQGVVYLAYAPDGRPVAVKLLFRSDAETRRRLTRELSALESVAPFCTARVLDASVDGPRPYVVSEFVDGPSLEQRVDRHGPLRDGELERLVVGTATALAAIHAAGVVHRDFKPSNVLLGPDGPRVVDFGIARADGPATHTSGLIGTPAYLSPEQIAGSPASPASDVFAWAATMVYAASGRSPFGADTVPAVLHRVMTHHPDLAALPARYRGLIASCLDKDPAHRPGARALMVSLVDPGAGAAPSTEDLARIGSEMASPTGAPYDPRGHAVPGPHPAAPPRHAAPGLPSAAGAHPSDPGRTGPGSSALTTRPGRRRPRGLVVGSVLVAASALVVAGIVVWTVLGDRTGAALGGETPATTGSASAGPTGNAAGETASAQPSGSGDPSSAEDGLKIPASFAGKWAGDDITSTNPLASGTKRIEVELQAGKADAGWAEPGSRCTGRIALQRVEQDTLVFALGADTGCVPGTVWLARKGDRLTYTWKDEPGLGLVTETGDLSRAS